MSMPKEKSPQTFEEKLKHLEKIIEKMEGGNADLETMLKLFEEGSKLGAECQDILNKAELRIKEITKNGSGGIEFKNFETKN